MTTSGAVLHEPRNIAARMGRWSATHRTTAILGWLAFVPIQAPPGGSTQDAAFAAAVQDVVA